MLVRISNASNRIKGLDFNVVRARNAALFWEWKEDIGFQRRQGKRYLSMGFCTSFVPDACNHGARLAVILVGHPETRGQQKDICTPPKLLNLKRAFLKILILRN